MALSRVAGVCRLALRTQWAAVRLLGSAAVGGEPSGDDKQRRRLVDLATLRRERALRPPTERTQPAPTRDVSSVQKSSDEQKQLNKAIRDSTSVDAVLDLVVAGQARLDHVGVSSALSMVAKLVDSSKPAQWLTGDARFKQLLHTAHLHMKRVAMDAQGFSNMLYACGKLGIAPPSGWLGVYWDSSSSMLHAFVPQALSNTLYSCGQLAIAPPAAWLESFWHTSASKLGEFTPQGLSNMWYACGQLGVAPPADWLQRFWHASASKLSECKPQDFSNTLYACGQLGIMPPADWLQSFWSVSLSRLSEFNEQSLSNTMYACGQLGLKPPAHWLLRFWHASALKLGEFLPQGLSNTMYACGQLGVSPSADWLHCFWHASAVKLSAFKPQELNNTLYACGQLGITPQADWLQRFWHVSAVNLSAFKPQELSNTLYACGQLGMTPQADWLQHLWHASASKLGEFKPQDFTNTLYACGQLGITPQADWLQSLSDSFERLLPDASRQDLANTALALAVLGLWELPLWPGLWARLCQCLPCDAADWNAESQLNAHQMYQAYQAAAVERPGLLAPPSPELLAAVRKSWIDNSGGTSSSRLHAEVSSCLTRMGVMHANERWCERAERSIDIAIEGAGAPVALEVDGPYHFLQDGRQDGSTRLRNRMLAAHGWRVVVVDYRVWQQQNTKAQREEYLRRLLA